MIVSTEVYVILDHKTYDYYVSLGYEIPSYIDSRGRPRKYKSGQQLKIKVSDLPKQSNAIIESKCLTCGKIRPISFSQESDTCWKCNLEKQKGKDHPRYQNISLYKINTKARVDDMRYKRVYGIDLNTYIDMLEFQNYRCKICNKHQNEEPRKFTVDHCHKTGKVRGLLCNRCNKGLGIFGDSVDLMIKGIEYLNAS